jgi:transposase-like protein
VFRGNNQRAYIIVYIKENIYAKIILLAHFSSQGSPSTPDCSENPFSQKKPTKEYIHVHFYCDEFNKTYVVESGVKHHNPNPLNTTYLMIRIQKLMLILL